MDASARVGRFAGAKHTKFGRVMRGFGFGLLLAGLAAAPAFAHAQLKSSSPMKDSTVSASPTEIVLTFSEPVTPAIMTVVDQDGHDVKGVGQPRADGNSLHLPLTAKLGEGHYTVTYRVVGADTHVVTGAVPFAVAVAAR